MARTSIASAHFPGGGPDGKHCRDCGGWAAAENGRRRVCLPAARLSGAAVPDLGDCDPWSRACKYYEERQT
jgi:hypothetical protein